MSEHRRAVLVYLAVLVPISAVVNWIDAGVRAGAWSGTAWLAALGVGAIGQFFLFESIYRSARREWPSAARRLAVFLGLFCVSTLGVLLAALALVVPAVLVAARWLIAPAFFIDRGTGVLGSLSASWRATRGHTGQIAVALVAVIVAQVLVELSIWAAVTFFSLVDGGVAASVLSAVASEAGAVALVALSAGAYSILAPPGRKLAETFA